MQTTTILTTQHKNQTWKLKKTIQAKLLYSKFTNNQEIVICYDPNFYYCPIYNLILCKLIRKLKLKILPCIVHIIDGNKLMVGIKNGDIQIFDLNTLKLIDNLIGHAYQVVQITSSSQYLITLCQNKEARIWNLTNFKLLFKINHQISVKQIQFSYDGEKVILIPYDGSVKIYRSQTGEIINQINHNIQQVYYIQYFQHNDSCLIGYQNKQNNTSILWNLTDLTNIVIFQGLNKRIINAYLNNNNYDLVVAFQSYPSLIIYSLLTSEIKAKINGLTLEMIEVDFTKHNHLIIQDTNNNILVYSDTGEFQYQFNTFVESKSSILKILSNENNLSNNNSQHLSNQIMNKDEQTNLSEYWLQTPAYFAPIN